jgi:hypothetical protein
MPVNGRKERLRAILRQTLEDQIAIEGAEGTSWRLPGPWGTFFEEHSAWDAATRLNHGLYLDLRRHFDDNLVREILLAAANVKISRITLSDNKIDLVRSIAEQYGFQLVTSEAEWILRADTGKGGWVNGAGRLAEPGEAGGVRNVYIASDQTLAETGRMLDEANEDDLFGALLGIPACCREAFEKFRPAAAEKQCDFVPFVLANTAGDMPYDWRLNYAAQYFGYSLLSFFPCSFRCGAAAAVAEKSLAMLAHCDAAWPEKFVQLQRTNVLYTENDGVHLFRSPLQDGAIAYEPQDLQSTESTHLAELLQRGDRLDVQGQRAVKIYRGSTKLGELSGEDVCLCAFLCSDSMRA